MTLGTAGGAGTMAVSSTGVISGDGSGLTGVGGLTTLVADDVAFGTGNVVKLSLGDYTKQTFWIRNIRSQAEEVGNLRLTDSSDNPITSSTYCGLTFFEGAYTSVPDANMLRFSSTRLPMVTDTIEFQDLQVNVYNAYSSSKRTEFDFRAYKSKTNGGGANSFRHLLSGIMETPQRNQSLYFIADNTTFLTGATYTSIGVN
jgi:hypothetical protein